MSYPTETDDQRPDGSPSGGRSTAPDGRLVPQFRVSDRMAPFLGRVHLRWEDFAPADPAKAIESERARNEMKAMLGKLKIPEDRAERAIGQMLEAALDQQLESQWRDKNLADFERSLDGLKLLTQHLKRAAQAIKKLSPVSKGELNKIVAAPDWRHFDTEIFAEFVQTILKALSELSPQRFAEEARSAMDGSFPAGMDQEVFKAERTAPPVVIELWDAIPAQTRTQVEAALRSRPRSAGSSAIKALDRLVALLKQHRPRMPKGNYHSVQRRYVKRIARICEGLGIYVGRVFDWKKGKQRESRAQRLARLALVAVGDSAQISGRQIANLKSQA